MGETHAGSRATATFASGCGGGVCPFASVTERVRARVPACGVCGGRVDAATGGVGRGGA